jgi:hypothetical protein
MKRSSAQRGQVVVIFALSIFVWVGMCAVVVDIAWYWASSLRMQRAADAAALAGVVFLPGDVPAARASARAEAAKNGYADGAGSTAVAAVADALNPRRLNVTVTGRVNTFFMRVFGLNDIPATRIAKAEYVLPVPMGSPENYYGVFGTLRTPGGGTTVTTTQDVATSWLPASATKGSSGWSSPGNVYTSNNAYATSSSTSATQAWGNFSVPSLPSGATVTGIELALEASRTGSGISTNCRIQVTLSWNNGSSYTSGGSGTKQTPALGTSDPDAPYHVLGGPTDLWGRSSWSASQLSNSNFRVRVQNVKPSCASSMVHRIDLVVLRVHYRTTSSVFVPDANVASPYGDALAPRGFWGTMLSQGAEDINGDAYLPRYESRTSFTNPEYDPGNYYDYAVEIPAGATGGEVWIYDPVFCATDGSGAYGTGDRWFGGTNAMSAFYELYDTQSTPYDLTDDTQVATSGTLFRSIRASDQSLGGPSSMDSCEQGDVTNPADGRYWHNRWWPLASGLTGGRTYRVRTRSTDTGNPNDQNSTNGHNSFAIWSRATGGSPRIYGIGAMQAFSPLAGGAASEFYLAQIDAVHAGKTMVIELWDPGDTGSLSASLQILRPSAGGYTPATLSWHAARGTVNSGASNCNGQTGSSVASITTNTGGSSRFNGCWVTIEIPIPTSYAAPTPPGETEGGWWKIRYVMGGDASNTSFDVTTWQVTIRGNPVHLVLP